MAYQCVRIDERYFILGLSSSPCSNRHFLDYSRANLKLSERHHVLITVDFGIVYSRCYHKPSSPHLLQFISHSLDTFAITHLLPPRPLALQLPDRREIPVTNVHTINLS